MPTCPDCSVENPPTSKFCAACGHDLMDAMEPTVDQLPDTSDQPAEAIRPRTSREAAKSPSQHGRFEPGTKLGDRYRIVALLGRGGMGEVYRADDLELGQSVALKFLPERLAANPEALRRFRNEVRTARQIAHPNVCRIYDIGEADGHVFLSMEYIDGEDLAHVLRRMGRPSKEKALEIARQLCLGLAAAHETGVLHRDLKPANVMIDGRGRVRITDFGLAGLIDELEASSEMAGTPAYMAPEQLASGSSSVRSDLYALGLVFYEVFAGQRVYETNNLTELKERHSSESVTSISSIIDEIDPAVDRLIQRCLEKSPEQRPSSIYAVLGALPGADPLTAALAAGETPSPELVAGAHDGAVISPRNALTYFVGSLLLLAISVAVAPLLRIDHYVPLPVSEDDLVFTARELLNELDHTELPTYRERGFAADLGVLQYVSKTDKSPDRWDRLAADHPGAVVFWYRTSRTPMMGTGLHDTDVFRRNPPLSGEGSAILELDREGKLLRLAIIPEVSEELDPAEEQSPGRLDTGDLDTQIQDRSSSVPSLSEGKLDAVFIAAGLDRADLVSSDMASAPPVYCDQIWSYQRKADAANGLDDPDQTRATIQVGSFQGRVNYFDVVTPWIEEDAESNPPVGVLVFAVCLVTAVCFSAFRNLKLGRGDRHGAFRLALFIAVSMLVGWSVRGIPSSGGPFDVFINLIGEKPLGHAVQHALVGWFLYMALEPLARRYWPSTLVTWTRLLMGRFSDPQIGRDILIGGLMSGAVVLIFFLGNQAIALVGRSVPIPDYQFLETLDLARTLTRTIGYAHVAATGPMAVLVIVVLARVITGSQRRAVVSVVVILTLIPFVQVIRQEGADLVTAAMVAATNLIWASLALFVLLRFGLLPTVMSAFAIFAIDGGASWDLTRWYAGPPLLPIVICVLLLTYGFFTSLAGRPMLGENPD